MYLIYPSVIVCSTVALFCIYNFNFKTSLANMILKVAVLNVCPFYCYFRSVGEAAKRGIERTLKAGIRSPIIIIQNVPKFKQNALVLLLGAFEALYVVCFLIAFI